MLIVGRGSGRLGNRLFTFAHFIGNAIEYKYKVMNPAFNQYAEYFVGTQKQIIPSYPQGVSCNNWGIRRFLRNFMHIALYSILYLLVKHIKRPRNAYCEVISMHYPKIYDWRHNGYLDKVHKKLFISNSWVFWDHQNFHKHANLIREYFRPLPCYESNIKYIVNESRRDADVLIGVHIRRGDYARYSEGKYFYSMDQYCNIMERIVNLFKEQRVKFLIVSNDNDIEKYFPEAKYCFGSGQFIEDMYVLAACDYIIGPPSSYSGWAAYYGDKPVYFIENPDKVIELADFIPFNSGSRPEEKNEGRKQ